MMTGLLTKELRIRLGSRLWVCPVWAVVLAAVGAGFFCQLGAWQLGRAAEKAHMTARYAMQLNQAAVPLVALLADAQATEIDDRRVTLDGRWDNSRTLFLENQMRGPKAGFHVYTVVFPEADPVGVLVNRGWVPMGVDVQQLPSVPPAVNGHMEGSVAYPSAYFTVGQPDYRQHPLRVPRLDLPELQRALDVQLRPFVIRLDSSHPEGFVREWAPATRLGMTPEKHRAYAFQWFSLAFAVLVVLLVVNLRKNGNANNE